VGSFFYVWSKNDFEMASAQKMFTERKLQKLYKLEKFDPEKIAFLEGYIHDLK
jgi:hypothetical protein